MCSPAEDQSTVASSRLSFGISSHRAVLTSLDQSETVTFAVKNVPAGGLGYAGWTFEDEQLSEDSAEGIRQLIQIFTVSLNGANILSTPIQSPTSWNRRGKCSSPLFKSGLWLLRHSSFRSTPLSLRDAVLLISAR